jgi:hypothetical protein
VTNKVGFSEMKLGLIIALQAKGGQRDNSDTTYALGLENPTNSSLHSAGNGVIMKTSLSLETGPIELS